LGQNQLSPQIANRGKQDMSHELAIVPSTASYLDKIKLPQDVVSIRGSMQYGEEFKYVTVNIDPKKFRTLEILHITDVQFGHLCCNVQRYDEYLKWVLASPNRFVLLGGDMIDAATALSIASPYENTVEPQSQILRFVELTALIRHRILGFVGGNHERRGVKTFGDLGRMIATLLRIPYSSGKQFIDINYGDHKPFKISLWHGGTGSRTKGAKMQMLHRFMSQGEAQLYLVGHLHDAMMTFDYRERRNKGQINLEKFAGVMSSSFLDHFGTYAEVAGMAPSGTIMWRTVLEPNGKWELTAR
jgi:hypothetical protein